MAIDLFVEDSISLHDAAKMFPRNARGKHPHVSQIYRYTTRGLRGVVLESLQCGARRCTTRAAVIRFIDALTIKAGKTKAIAPSLNSKLPEVEKELDRLGIGGSSNKQPKADNK